MLHTPNPTVDPRFAEIKELSEACKRGDIPRVLDLLQRHPDVLDSPDRDTRFPYPESCLWSPLGIAAMHGHEALVKSLLAMGANPVPFEIGAQYHHHTYWNWPNDLRERGYDTIADTIVAAIRERYGPLLDEGNLRQAVIDGNVERVRALVDEKPERARQVDMVANTPLHVAVAANNLAVARLLIEKGSPIDARNATGRTPSLIALFGLHRWWRNEEKPEILDLLLKSGAEYTILIAATRGDESRVRDLLRADRSFTNSLDPCYRRPLSGAAAKGHTEIVRILLEHGADPNAKEAICEGGFSLREAAGKGYKEIVRLLLDHGAVPEHWVDSSGEALFAARHGGHEDVVQLLYSYGATMQLQVYAAAHRIDVIAEVLKLQPSRAGEVLPYGWDDNGSEELAYNIMRLAIRYGARFENASEWNLRWTITKYPKVFRLLQEHGASPDPPLLGIAGDESRRYKDAAAQLRAVTFLVEECGADVNYMQNNLTPLAVAARIGHTEIARYLISRGANINPDVSAWAKPLALAERRGNKEIVAMLR